MSISVSPRCPRVHTRLVVAAALALFTACADELPLATDQERAAVAQFATLPFSAEQNVAVAAIRRATARYHDLNAAIADGFVHLHDCEVRPDEGPIGIVYVHPGRLDAIVDPSLPEALIYEPRRNGQPRLVGAELVVPFAAWAAEEPPTFLGATFQREDEFGVFGLHVWIWRHNPEGLFAESNPNVSCEPS